MNMIDFSHNIPSDQLLNIFKNFFEQHMVAYDLLKDIDLVNFKVTEDVSSIFYSVKIMKAVVFQALFKSVLVMLKRFIRNSKVRN